MLHRKGQTQAPLDTDERSLTIGSFHDAYLGSKIYSPHVHPAVGRRGELDNDCLYLHHPSRRLDQQSPLAFTLISLSHSPELIDNNSYLTCVYSTDSATTSAFLVYIYIPDSTVEGMQKSGALTSLVNLTNSMIVEPLTDTHKIPYLDDEQISRTMNK